MRPRAFVKTAVAATCHATGLGRLVGGFSGARVMPLVVAYHRVTDDFAGQARRTIPAMLVSARMLERHLDWLARTYRIVSLDELGTRLLSGAPAGDLAAVTFDDGYRDLYEHALPLLRGKGIPAAVFVVTDFIGTGRVPLHDRLYVLSGRALARWRSARAVLGLLRQHGVAINGLGRLAETTSPLELATRLLVGLPQTEAESAAHVLQQEVTLPASDLEGMLPLTWDMLVEMRSAGLTVGSHTRAHALLTCEDADRVRDEVAGSRAEIEVRLGAEVRHFAYPDGRWDVATVRAVSAGGYRFAYTICPHSDASAPLLTIPRTVLWERAAVDAFGRFSEGIMSAHASGLFRLGRPCQRHHGIRRCAASPES